MAQIKILTMWNHGEAVEQYKLSSAADKIAKWRPGESQAVRILPHKPEDQTLEPQDPHKKSGVVVSVSITPLLGGQSEVGPWISLGCLAKPV